MSEPEKKKIKTENGHREEVDLSEELRSLIKEAEQAHLLVHFDRLKHNPATSPEDLKAFLQQLQAIDYRKVNADFARATKPKISKEDLIEPLPVGDHWNVDSDPEKRREWEKVGIDCIKQGKVSVLLMAGGQGTRLGSTSPKGLFKVGLLSGKSLFQIQAERIVRLQKLAGENVVIPWYIMTSEHTDKETMDYFQANNYFGLDPSNIVFFTQGEFPCMSLDGKILMDSPSSIALSPNGNGGLYASLHSEGILSDMEKRGINYVHVYGVDNVLVRLADPVFIGYCVSRKSPCGAKAVPKSHPNEAVGVFALRNNTYQVIEYSEIDEERKNQRDEQGNLLYIAGNIANHFFTLDFLKDMAKNHLDDLEFHIAKKKIKYISDDGVLVNPEQPNGIKLEMFVFDVFRFSKEFAVLLVKREEEFSPLKNATGAKDCTPETCRNDLFALHKSYLEQAGAKVIAGNNGENEIEISPLLSYSGEGLEGVSGLTFQCPVLIDSHSDFSHKSIAK